MTTQGHLLARHSILHELGRGATGAVFAARERNTGAVVALKRLDPALVKTTEAGFAERLARQRRAARRLAHANVAKVHDVDESAGAVYVAMELVEGESLRQLLDGGPLPLARAIRIAHGMASGLAHAHLEGVVHGGLTPSNVLVSRSGAVKLTDFGIAQLARPAPSSAAPAGLKYMAPEQLRGEQVDHRCDIFSLGAVFYEMLAGRPPFEGHAPKDLADAMLRARPRPPSELNEHVPHALDAIVASMLAAAPASRMPGVPILLRELERIEEALGLASGPGARVEPPAPSVPPAEPRPEPVLRAVQPERPEQFQHRKLTEQEILQYARERTDQAPWPERPSRSRPALFAAVLALAGIALGLTSELMGFTGVIDHWSRYSGRGVMANGPQQPPAPVAEAPKQPVTPPPAPVAKAPKQPVAAPPAPVAEAPKVVQAEALAEVPKVAEAPKEPVAPSPAPQASPPSVASNAKAAPSAPARRPANPLGADPDALAVLESLTANAPAPRKAIEPAPAKQLPRSASSTAKVSAPAHGAKARVVLSVSPRGDVYIDGEHQGSTPPFTTFELDPGMHRIEVRSGSRKPFLTYMTVEAGDVRRIQHDFEAKGSRPPR